MQLIGVTGKKYHGKDTIANYLVSKYGFTKISFADTLKKSMKEIFSFSDEQLWGNKKEEIDPFWNISPREILQYVGTELFRCNFGNKYPTIRDRIWIMALDKKIKNLNENGITKIVIADVRFPNEVEFIRQHNGIILKVVRNLSTKNNDCHISENNIDLINEDVLLSNNIIEKLYDDIDLFMSSV